MSKASRAFVCQACGAVTARWSGKCPSCGEWNSIIEEAAPSGSPALVAIRGGKGRSHSGRLASARLAPLETLAAASIDAPRLPTGIAELDRVLAFYSGISIAWPVVASKSTRTAGTKR